jgi:FkbM family methyltransferase
LINIFKLFIPNFCLRLARNYDLTGKFQNFFSPYNLVYAQNHSIEIFEDTKTSPIAQSKIYEQETTYFIRNYLKENDIVYDVGANIGYFTLEFARAVGKNGKVHSFEPHPEIFKVLQRNIKRNHYNNVTMHNVACSDKNGEGELYFSTENEGNHKIVKNINSNNSKVVSTVKLSDFVLKEKPRLIKMDIEGAELLALKGVGNDILKIENIDFILEYHPYEMSFFEIEGEQVLDFFMSSGYKFRNLAYPDAPNISKEEILKKYKKEDRSLTNLFCSKAIDQVF